MQKIMTQFFTKNTKRNFWAMVKVSKRKCSNTTKNKHTTFCLQLFRTSLSQKNQHSWIPNWYWTTLIHWKSKACLLTMIEQNLLPKNSKVSLLMPKNTSFSMFGRQKLITSKERWKWKFKTKRKNFKTWSTTKVHL